MIRNVNFVILNLLRTVETFILPVAFALWSYLRFPPKQ